MRAVRGADDVLDVGKVFFQDAAFVVRHLGDVARSDAHAVVGKHAEGGSLLEGRDFRRAQRDRQVGRDVRGDAEAVGVVDHRLDAEVVGQLQRGNVARLGQRAAQRDRAFKFLVVIVRSVRAGRRVESDGRIEDRVVGRGARSMAAV